MAVTPYCTWESVQSRLSAEGAALAVDDDPATRTQVLADAATEVNGYCELLYSVAALAASAWVAKKTKDIAVYYAVTRRGNPAPHSIQAAYDKAIEDLEKVQMSQTQIPDAPQRKASAPVLSNQRAATYPVNRVVTVRGKSTGTPEGYVAHDDRQAEGIDYSI